MPRLILSIFSTLTQLIDLKMDIIRNLVDYSDIAFESPPVSPRTVEANMSYNLVKTGKNFVKADNHLWEIDVDSDDTGLFRQNAMTFYQSMTPYLVLARDFNTQERLFFLVKVKNHPQNWLKIDLDRGDNLYNIKQIK